MPAAPALASQAPARRPSLRPVACAALLALGTALSHSAWAQASGNAPLSAIRLSLSELQERNALAIRAAARVLDQDFSAARHAPMDAALADNAAIARRAAELGETHVQQRLAWDRIVALRLRGDAAQAVAAFEALPPDTPPAPAYVRRALADAWLMLREPGRARALYTALIAESPEAEGLQQALAYAELESEELAAAVRRTDATRRAFPASAAAQRTHAVMLRFTDRLRAAEAAVDDLLRAAPDDAGLWLEQADLWMARGRPRAAEARYRAVLAQEPGQLRARVGLANALWAQGALAEARAGLESLLRDAPEHPAVRRLQADWQRQQRPIVSTELTRGWGVGVIAGDGDLRWDSRVESGLLGDGLRVHARHHLARAHFGTSDASHERLAGGLSWTARNLQLEAELGSELRNAHASAWAVAGRLALDDHWSLAARHERRTDDFPLKGRVPGSEPWAPWHLQASRSTASLAWRADESRRLDLRLSHYAFNDGNTRRALDAGWTERLRHADGDSLDLVASVYTSRNSLPDTVYFNPKRDLALSLTLAADWLGWRRYERHFRQVAALTLGSYREIAAVRPAPGAAFAELDHGWRPYAELRYGHEWQWGPERVTRYGVGARRFPYDGRAETKLYAYLQHSWRF